MTATIAAFAGPAVMLALGAALGGVYFSALRRTAGLLAGGSGWAAPVLLTLARLAGAVAVLGIAAWFGAMTLLAAFLGFLVARTLALRQARRAL